MCGSGIVDGSIDVDSGVTRLVSLNNAGAREIAAALAELAGEGVSIVPVDSSNAIALRGEAKHLRHVGEHLIALKGVKHGKLVLSGVQP